MGGRIGNLGGYLRSSDLERTGSYETLANGPGEMKIIQGVGNENRSAPIFSNSPNRVYVNINKKTKQIESITVYKNHKEVFTIHPGTDGTHGGLHVHTPRVKGEKRHFIKVTNEHRDIYEKALKAYNKVKK